MFEDPPSFLKMAGKSEQEIEEFNKLPQTEKDDHLLGVYKKDVTPSLLDKAVMGYPFNRS
jgi:hypothetical protein